MKRLKSILAALAVLRRTPSSAIASAWKTVESCASSDIIADIELIGNIIDAVVAIAKDDEDKATAAGKADKP